MKTHNKIFILAVVALSVFSCKDSEDDEIDDFPPVVIVPQKKVEDKCMEYIHFETENVPAAIYMAETDSTKNKVETENE